VYHDVKPANVMMARTGEVLLTDFGIAVNRNDPGLTATGMFIGTAAYTAPERLLGQQARAASDLFSLGATLYHAVEGVSPFARGTEEASAAAVLHDQPQPPQHAGGLATLIMRLLDKDPDKRPTVRQALALIGTDTSDTAGQDRTTQKHTRALNETVVRGPRGRPDKTVASVIVVVTLIAVAIAMWGRDARSAQPGDCVYLSSHKWLLEPCSLPFPFPDGANYKVHQRIEGASESCFNDSEWDELPGRTQAILPANSSSQGIVLCVAPA
jgi:serine/threonine protein kinase